ncbi:MAG: 16S rRNA (cytidine1402-2'-O)-methyltransferase [Marivirga sp.]|jgi:16S rRNA (cytidine1402-2'-O)-methyltransferase
MNTPKGTLYLIPTVISPNTESRALPLDLKNLCEKLDYYLVEQIRTARRCLSALKIQKSIEEIQFKELSKKTDPQMLEGLMKPLFEGKDIGIMSEAGCPGIADPGALAVEFAHKHGVRVIPYVGPSSIFLALMASGFSGQSFAFNGYLPIDKKEKQQQIKKLEDLLYQTGQTQIFMETPYRNNAMFADILKTARPQTSLCIAKDINGDNEFIRTKTIVEWKKESLDLHKIPCIFLIG